MSTETHINQPVSLADLDRLWANLETACARPAAEAGSTTTHEYPLHLTFGLGGNAAPFQLFGWSHAESGGNWAVGREAMLDLPAARWPRPGFLNLRVTPLTGPGLNAQRVRLVAGEIELARWQISTPGHYFALLPETFLQHPLELSFQLPDAVIPRAIGLSADDRELALNFHELWLTPWETVSF